MLLSKLKMSIVTMILMVSIIGIESKYIPRHKPEATRVARNSKPETPVDPVKVPQKDPGASMTFGPIDEAPISARKVDDAADDVNRLTDNMDNKEADKLVVVSDKMEDEPKVTVLSSPTVDELPKKQEDAALPASDALPAVAAEPSAPVAAAAPSVTPAAELPLVVSDPVEVISSSNNQEPVEEAVFVHQINNDNVYGADVARPNPEAPVKANYYKGMRPLRMFGGYMRDAWKMYKSYVFGYMPHMLSGK